jgi:hypothetical protein
MIHRINLGNQKLFPILHFSAHLTTNSMDSTYLPMIASIHGSLQAHSYILSFYMQLICKFLFPKFFINGLLKCGGSKCSPLTTSCGYEARLAYFTIINNTRSIILNLQKMLKFEICR